MGQREDAYIEHLDSRLDQSKADLLQWTERLPRQINLLAGCDGIFQLAAQMEVDRQVKAALRHGTITKASSISAFAVSETIKRALWQNHNSTSETTNLFDMYRITAWAQIAKETQDYHE